MNKNNAVAFFNTNKFEILTFCLFVALLVCVSLFHEPWFDEFQAWGISKDSIYNILFVIPHNEGHPPLLYLILKCLSSFNVPAEVGLKTVNIVFISFAMALLIFKSPFPRKYRLVLPFTYFFFYQYGVISRPYSIFCFALFIAACLFKSKDEHPLKYALSLCFLCLTSAYGIVTAAGLAIGWVYQIAKEKGLKAFFNQLFSDKRTKSLFILLVLGLLLVLEIYPNPNTFATYKILSVDYVMKFLYSFFGIPSDALLTDVFHISQEEIYYYEFWDFLKLSHEKVFDTLIVCFWFSVAFGLLVNVMLFKTFAKLKQLPLYISSVFPFLLMCFLLYVSRHHIGLYFVLVVFALWTALTVSSNVEDLRPKKALKFFVNFLIFIQLFWALTASINDIFYNYNFGREVASYIKQNKLENRKMMSAWLFKTVMYDKKTKKNFFSSEGRDIEFKLSVEPNMQVIPVSVNQYFNKNLFYNFEIVNQNRQYLVLVHYPESVAENFIKLFWEGEPPEIIVGYVNDPIVKTNYTLVRLFEFGIISKNTRDISKLPLYVRNDLLEKANEV